MAATSTAGAKADARGERLGRDILALAVVVILGTIMTVLDLTIVNVAGSPPASAPWPARSASPSGPRSPSPRPPSYPRCSCRGGLRAYPA